MDFVGGRHGFVAFSSNRYWLLTVMLGLGLGLSLEALALTSIVIVKLLHTVAYVMVVK